MKAIIFDADHTLYRPRTEKAYGEMFSFLGSKLGVSPEALEEKWREFVKTLVGQGVRDSKRRSREYSTAEVLKQFGVEESEARALAGEALKIFWERVVKDLEFDPKVRELIKNLGKRYRLCVSSDEFRKSLELKLNRVFGDWKKYFEFIVSADDTGELKPSEKFCTIPLERFELPPSEVAFVGDSWERELEVAKRLGLKTILVNSEREGNPDYWIRDVFELREIL